MKDALKPIIDAMLRVDPNVCFRVRFWNDDEIAGGTGTPQFTVWFKTRSALQRLLADGFSGFGDSYTAGDIEVDGDMLLLFKLGHLMGYGAAPLSLKETLRFAAASLINRNTLRRSRKNIEHHYDIGSDFHELFLARIMHQGWRV